MNHVEIKGYFYGGKIGGYGEMIDHETEEIVRGNFEQGQKSGYCIQTVENLEFKGEFESDKRNGFGILTMEEPKIVIKGFWSNDIQEGFSQILSDNEIYIGEFRLGYKQGVGQMTNFQPNKVVYTGIFEKNVKNGFGEEKTSLYRYIGGWKDGKKYGLGYCKFKQDVEYLGYWKDDKRHGIGIYKSPEKVIQAEWSADFIDGLAHVQAPNKRAVVKKYRKGRLEQLIQKLPKEFLAKFKTLDFENYLEFTKKKLESINSLIRKSKSVIHDNTEITKNELDVPQKVLEKEILALKASFIKIQNTAKTTQGIIAGALKNFNFNTKKLKLIVENGDSTLGLLGKTIPFAQRMMDINYYEGEEEQGFKIGFEKKYYKNQKSFETEENPQKQALDSINIGELVQDKPPTRRNIMACYKGVNNKHEISMYRVPKRLVKLKKMERQVAQNDMHVSKINFEVNNVNANEDGDGDDSEYSDNYSEIEASNPNVVDNNEAQDVNDGVVEDSKSEPLKNDDMDVKEGNSIQQQKEDGEEDETQDVKEDQANEADKDTQNEVNSDEQIQELEDTQTTGEKQTNEEIVEEAKNEEEETVQDEEKETNQDNKVPKEEGESINIEQDKTKTDEDGNNDNEVVKEDENIEDPSPLKDTQNSLVEPLEIEMEVEASGELRKEPTLIEPPLEEEDKEKHVEDDDNKAKNESQTNTGTTEKPEEQKSD